MAIKEGKKLLGIVVPLETYKRIEALAKKECRSVSNYSLMLLLKALEQSEGKRD